ncbi:hypothetical protein Moror_14272 [Moniliophthora roreri MCA 2997]|uniref:Methyltransferase domain-containing protein n=2 Tax=Moniliophthora roreri TaxID=221103 RepID=V2X6E1_MONRO|nr:hypothetical protein Moror_14272 [Moniliophthora roreri MCA 2997]
MASTHDVEALLLKERVSRRKRGEVVYPLDYTADILNYDNWDHLWLMSCFRGLTMHQFETPPKFVLDLGCGGGLWAIEAARQWPESTIIGFDTKDIQPRLYQIEAYSDLARRVKWVQGNLLDGLHFPPDYFDLVRIARIGLGVPEDEWQFVLEEVSRVMKPGAVLEIIEEDLIFPYGEFSRPRPRPSPLTIDLPMNDSPISGTVSARSSLASSNPWISSQEDLLDFTSKKTNLSPLQESPTSLSPPPSTHSIPRTPHSLRSHSSHFLPQPTIPNPSYQSHPQDHSRLKSAWDAMLSQRFLTPQLVTVLPFYLSFCFTDVKTHPPLQIELPPNSSGTRNCRDHQSENFDPIRQFTLHPTSRRLSDADDSSSLDSENSELRKPVSNWASMHLQRSVQMVIACKESIWVEYQRMYSPDLPPVSGRRKDGQYFPSNSKSSARESFDRAWTNWEK